MDFFDKYKFSSDNPEEFGINPNDFKKSDVLDESHLSNLLSTSIRITEDIIPKVYKSIKSVFKKLKVENKFDFFVTSDTYQANASCNLMSVSSKPYIILTSKLIELLNSKELEFVIGHEVAHYIYQHALYPNPQTTENRSLKLNILNLSRAAEISADRIGFLACGDLEASLRTNLKLASGLDDKHLNFKFSAYLDQLRELETLGKSNSQLFSTHPSFLIRMQALFWFSMTKEYHEFFETKKKGSCSISEIDKKIENTIKKVIGNEIDISNKEILDRALFWGSLSLYLIDKKFTKSEQDKFIRQFGQKKASKAISFLKISNKDMLERKVNDSFSEASNLLKTDKNSLFNDLKKISQTIEGNQSKKNVILNKLSKVLGIH
mgnify:CR=1 FL=1|tara:strand:- start:823 stop:1956 length:1134 start_codon:yes stop_codon:yes gene_type:complete